MIASLYIHFDFGSVINIKQLLNSVLVGYEELLKGDRRLRIFSAQLPRDSKYSYILFTPCHKTDKSHAAEIDLVEVSFISGVAHQMLCAENVRSHLSPLFKAEVRVICRSQNIPR